LSASLRTGISPSLLCMAAALFLCFVPFDKASGQPEPYSILDAMSDAYSKVDDYTAIFIKQELVDGELLPEETIRFKFKKPFKVYMGWMEGPHEGREALYVEGENDNQVVGHEGGFLGLVTLNMEPAGSMAMKGNRHPITDVGIGRLIEIIETNGRRAKDQGELKLGYMGVEKVFGRTTHHIEAGLPPGKGYYAGRFDIWVDTENGLPVKIRIFGWDGALWESYGYNDLRLNPGLADAEFEEDYEDYDF